MVEQVGRRKILQREGDNITDTWVVKQEGVQHIKE